MRFRSVRACLDYVKCKIKEAEKAERWQVYIAEVLRVGFGGNMIRMSYAEFERKANEKPDKRSAKEIIQDVAKRAGLEVI